MSEARGDRLMFRREYADNSADHTTDSCCAQDVGVEGRACRVPRALLWRRVLASQTGVDRSAERGRRTDERLLGGTGGRGDQKEKE